MYYCVASLALDTTALLQLKLQSVLSFDCCCDRCDYSCLIATLLTVLHIHVHAIALFVAVIVRWRT
jgi:hypothetical protein